MIKATLVKRPLSRDSYHAETIQAIYIANQLTGLHINGVITCGTIEPLQITQGS